MSYSATLKNESVNRTFWRYAIPSILAMVVNGLYLVIDGIFVGHYVGADGLAGINMIIPVIATVIGVGMLIGMGGGSIISRQRGNGDISSINNVLKTSVWLILLFGSLSSIVLLLSAEWTLNLQRAEADPKHFALEFLTVLSYGAVFTVASSALPLLVRNDDSPKFSTLIILIGSLTNILLDYVFLAHLELGLKGAAYATVIAQIVTAVLSVGYFASHLSQVHILKGNFRWTLAREIIELGSSTLVMFAYFGFVLALHNMLFMQYGDATYVAAFAIVGYIASIYYYFTEGIANGMQPPVSFYFGANQPKKLIQTVKIAFSVSVGLGVLVTVALQIFPEAAIALFSTGDMNLTEAAKQGIHLHLIGISLDGFLFAASVFFMAIGMGGKALFVSAGNMFIQLPFLYVLPKLLGITGIWLSVPLSNLALTAIVLPMMIVSLRKLSQPTSNKIGLQSSYQES